MCIIILVYILAPGQLVQIRIYRIAGNFGDLANWVKITKFKTRQFKLNAGVSMALSIQIAKFKFHQYELRVVSPNLMLTSISVIMI